MRVFSSGIWDWDNKRCVYYLCVFDYKWCKYIHILYIFIIHTCIKNIQYIYMWLYNIFSIHSKYYMSFDIWCIIMILIFNTRYIHIIPMCISIVANVILVARRQTCSTMFFEPNYCIQTWQIWHLWSFPINLTTLTYHCQAFSLHRIPRTGISHRSRTVRRNRKWALMDSFKPYPKRRSSDRVEFFAGVLKQ